MPWIISECSLITYISFRGADKWTLKIFIKGDIILCPGTFRPLHPKRQWCRRRTRGTRWRRPVPTRRTPACGFERPAEKNENLTAGTCLESTVGAKSPCSDWLPPWCRWRIPHTCLSCPNWWNHMELLGLSINDNYSSALKMLVLQGSHYAAYAIISLRS